MPPSAALSVKWIGHRLDDRGLIRSIGIHLYLHRWQRLWGPSTLLSNGNSCPWCALEANYLHIVKRLAIRGAMLNIVFTHASSWHGAPTSTAITLTLRLPPLLRIRGWVSQLCFPWPFSVFAGKWCANTVTYPSQTWLDSEWLELRPCGAMRQSQAGKDITTEAAEFTLL
jgi:hypothetical protein